MLSREDLQNILEEGKTAIERASSLRELDQVRIEYLGKKGRLTSVLKTLGQLPPEERKEVGRVANEVRQKLEVDILARQDELSRAEKAERLIAETVDITLPGRQSVFGNRHLIAQVINEITDIFIGLGYKVAEGPEVELDYYNFKALNTPADHPARSLQDTFYIKKESVQPADDDILLRTHTSPVQIRVMKSQQPPVYIIAPGRAYRRDVPDPTHSPMFHQVEGLAVDEGITFGDLKGTLEEFTKQLFGRERQVRMLAREGFIEQPPENDQRIRLRPHFFPFTEPSAEVDVRCIACGGVGCRICGGGWLEILGAGMVDPNVLIEVGYDPERVSGFAFGMGVERIAMLMYGVPDIRMFVDNDMRFISQF
ncbi:MAG: phenylalanine--tRNA ligase subunit alpha [Actinobacteria bacterium]|nr:phenylalanine--tRNA ligase subunit alpha [Actinomycetota bacterium]